MNECLTTLFVVPTGNTIPTTGTNANLTGTQFGIFLPDYSAATTGTAATAKYIFFSQGRNISSTFEFTKNSGKIYPENVIDFYKVTGSLGYANQVTEISNLTVNCNEDVSITLRLDSYYLRPSYANGLTRSVLVTTPCCNCGANPCDTLTEENAQLVMEQLAQAINSDEILSLYVTAGTDGTGFSTVIYIEGNPLTVYANNGDLTNFPYQFDRLWFRTFLRTGPELTTDYEIDDICVTVGTVNIVQRSSYPIATPAEVQQMEKDYFSYNADMNEIFSNVNFNGEFATYVDSNLAYDLYYLVFKEFVKNTGEFGVFPDVQTVILAIPQGDTDEAGIVAILTAAFGTPVNEMVTISSTTTFSTSSTTTTTTTNVTP